MTKKDVARNHLIACGIVAKRDGESIFSGILRGIIDIAGMDVEFSVNEMHEIVKDVDRWDSIFA